jgi:hypothetical protein
VENEKYHRFKIVIVDKSRRPPNISLFSILEALKRLRFCLCRSLFIKTIKITIKIFNLIE